MKKDTLILLIAWIEQVLGIILYQSNIFPQKHREELHIATSELLKALRKE